MSFAFAGIEYNSEKIKFHITNGKKIKNSHTCKIGTNKISSTISFLREYAKSKDIKLLGAAFPNIDEANELASDLWLKLDISPFISNKSAKQNAQFAKLQFSIEDGSYPAIYDKDFKVITPPLARLSDYEEISPTEEIQELLKLSAKLSDTRFIFISATPQGGGVALMRHSLMRIYSQLNLNTAWYVLEDHPDIFKITKNKFHNVLQSVAEGGVTLTEEEMQMFDKWSDKNAKNLAKPIKNSDVIIIDDPQPSGLIPYIRKLNKSAKVIYRSHIQLVAKLANKIGTAQNITWQFIWDKIKTSNLFVAHPKKEFVPKQVNKQKIVYLGATTDRLDGLNKELTDEQKQYYMSILNDLLEKSGQSHLDLTRPFITQIARFDPSKGIPDLLNSYKLLCKKLSKAKIEAPQLVIAGNSSVDDPDGIPIYNAAMETINTAPFKNIKNDIKVLRLPHRDQLLNTIARESLVVLQLSHKEGFEVKVTEGLMKGKPVVVYNTGGIPLQVKNNINGFIVETGDVDAVADSLYKLLTDKKLYQTMSIAARKKYLRDVNSITNALEWLKMVDSLT